MNKPIETSASNQVRNQECSRSFLKRRRSPYYCSSIVAVTKFQFILSLIFIFGISTSNTHLQRDIEVEEDQITQPKEFSRERNPLRFRPRMWSCEKGKCVKRLLQGNKDVKDKTKEARDKRRNTYILN